MCHFGLYRQPLNHPASTSFFLSAVWWKDLRSEVLFGNMAAVRPPKLTIVLGIIGLRDLTYNLQP